MMAASSPPTRRPARSSGTRTSRDQPDLELTAAPLALKDSILVGASGGDRGVRDWLAALDPKTGNMQWKTYTIPAPGEPGSETWKDKDNAWQTGGGAFYVTGSYDPAQQSHLLGHRQSGPELRFRLPAGRQSLHRRARIAFDAAHRQDQWYFQYTPNDNRDYDETGTHIIIDAKVNGEDRKIIVACRPQRLQLHVRPPQRPVPQGRRNTSPR